MRPQERIGKTEQVGPVTAVGEFAATSSLTVSPSMPIPRRASDAVDLLTVSEIGELVFRAGFNQPQVGESHVELTPAVPLVQGRGRIQASGDLSSWDPASNVVFWREASTWMDIPVGSMNVWLHGLTAGHAYITQIRVTGLALAPVPAVFILDATDAYYAEYHTGAGGHNLTLVMSEVSSANARIRISCRGIPAWIFHDAVVTYLGKL
jgi:hypothetical protein